MGEWLEAYAQQLGLPGPSPAELAEMIATFQNQDQARFIVDTDTGWVVYLTHTRVASVLGQSQEETFSLLELDHSP